MEYARLIVFSENQKALATIDRMAHIHAQVETNRDSKIPAEAYRDVLFMLIDYSIRSFELLDRKLSLPEKEEVFDVFNRVGKRMGLEMLPSDYSSWKTARSEHMEQNLVQSTYTKNLFQQYRKHLGQIRYLCLLEAQLLVVPVQVSNLLRLRRYSLLAPMVPFYKLSRKLRIDGVIKNLLLPQKHMARIRRLDMNV